MSATEAGNLGTSGVSAEAGSFDTSGVSAETGIFDTSGVSAETGIFDAGGVSAEAGNFDTSGVSAEAGIFDTSGVSAETGIFDAGGVSAEGGIFETSGLNARGESYTTDVTPMSKSARGESFDTRGIKTGGNLGTSSAKTEGGIFETSGLNARDESYTTDVTPMSKSTGGESYTRGITHRLPKLIPVVSPQPISFSFSGRTPSGLNSHCGVRSAFSFSRSRFLFPCGGVV